MLCETEVESVSEDKTRVRKWEREWDGERAVSEGEREGGSEGSRREWDEERE